ncbi:MAG: hypothetical protein WBN48_15950, partial [Thiogranum sp.]
YRPNRERRLKNGATSPDAMLFAYSYPWGGRSISAQKQGFLVKNNSFNGIDLCWGDSFER